ncbi:MAG: amino acid ABC transporter permease [Clostridium sp.]|jgi:polar amino acid transport system permease protein|uniref:amino acid ABC transporter permease n=1 Tax=Clostridium sp. TaxID=1506 RepID=UPI0025C06874|nr:amino acid ABC transporter permease [Clostridium sp.]MCH3964382.1 amino acid ABC transporter permease [Clostridium sp.]MCI1715557.1 amino acid ABC transporter permease [Clostridium sp.]MCI1799651.1 amino acid ABC transporter permease [Clostridium sp.]MCI1813741.1 amino acid ABC transporter permease [Clostridium sp.]MCI1870464.1 amino acid ABC transporter permease [Clostridium sp.]
MNIDVIISSMPVILRGCVMTIELTVISLLIATLLGILISLLKISSNKVLSYIASFYTWIIRGTPLLVQLFFIYYGLPAIGITLTEFSAAVIALSLNSAAYMAEIIRGGILGIDKGQTEAAKALGFSYVQTMRIIILPQTIRIILPALGNEFIAMIKDTSLVSTIAMVELMRTAQQISSAKFAPIEMYLTAACMYLIMTTVFTALFTAFERKMSKYA